MRVLAALENSRSCRPVYLLPLHSLIIELHNQAEINTCGPALPAREKRRLKHMTLHSVVSNGRSVPVETRKRHVSAAREAAERLFQKRSTALFGAPANANAPRILEDVSSTLPVVVKDETDHEKVFRLVGEQKFEEAARIAARLINDGDTSDFMVYGRLATYKRTEAWFKDTVTATRRSPATVIQTITPELAQVLLLHNDGNRRVKSANLARIMRDIVSGRWHLNGESIIVSKDGTVNDGQHRNYAVLLTGQSIKTVMSFGLSRESMRTVDIGEKRQAKDRLNIAGVHDYIKLAAIASMAFETYNGRAATPPEADDYFHENRELIERAHATIGTNMRGVGPSAAGVAALHLIRMGHDDAEIKEFFAKIRSGEMLSRNDPRMTLHRAIFVDKYKLKLTRDNWLRAFVNHFIALKEGRKPTEVLYAKPLPEVK